MNTYLHFVRIGLYLSLFIDQIFFRNWVYISIILCKCMIVRFMYIYLKVKMEWVVIPCVFVSLKMVNVPVIWKSVMCVFWCFKFQKISLISATNFLTNWWYTYDDRYHLKIKHEILDFERHFLKLWFLNSCVSLPFSDILENYITQFVQSKW